MKIICKILIVTLWLAPFAQTSEATAADLETTEHNFTQSLSLVLSDLNAEIASKNRTFIAEKIAQIRAKKLKLQQRQRQQLQQEEEEDGDQRISADTQFVSPKFEKRSRRKKLKQKCVALAGHFKGNRKPLRRRIW